MDPEIISLLEHVIVHLCGWNKGFFEIELSHNITVRFCEVPTFMGYSIEYEETSTSGLPHDYTHKIVDVEGLCSLIAPAALAAKLLEELSVVEQMLKNDGEQLEWQQRKLGELVKESNV
jgi:hypothetical protein